MINFKEYWENIGQIIDYIRNDDIIYNINKIYTYEKNSNGIKTIVKKIIC
jgi:hypothetical protein